ncbi:unnamed protein product, partial [Linum tenue]
IVRYTKTLLLQYILPSCLQAHHNITKTRTNFCRTSMPFHNLCRRTAVPPSINECTSDTDSVSKWPNLKISLKPERSNFPS